MSKTIIATYDGHVLRPDGALDLEPNVKYQVTIETIEEEPATGHADAWSTLSKLAGSIEAPVDWSAEHDHYLYGTPKHQTDQTA